MRRLLLAMLTVVVLAVTAWEAGLISPDSASAQQPPDEQSFTGTISFEDKPAAGIVIVVATPEGKEVGRATTTPEGTWTVKVPQPGQYRVSVDLKSLPTGAGLESADQEKRVLTVSPLQSKPVPISLVRGGATASGSSAATASGGDSNVRRALQLFVEGIKFGLIIAMCAIGLSLIFGTTGLTNFAHGELVTLGALIAWMFNVRFGLNLIVAGALSVGICFVVGLALEAGFFGPLRRRGFSLISLMVITIGLSILVRYIYLYIFGGRTRAYSDYAVQQGWKIGPITITPAALVSVTLSIIVLAGVGLLLQRTKIGKAMRAVADNRDLAASSGIDVQRVILLVWGFGAGLAGLGGVLLGLAEQAGWEMGTKLLLLMFAGVTLGGLGTAYGALLGSLLVGIFLQMSTMVIPPELKTVGALALLILALIFRPQGLLGQRERIG